MSTICLISGGLLLCAVALSLPTCYADGKEQYVESIRQNYKDKINSQLIQQIHGFHENVLFYQAYASYFHRADVNLPGFHKFFTSLSEERKESAKIMTAFINQRGGYTQFRDVNLCKVCSSLKDGLKRFPHLCFFVLNEQNNVNQETAVKKRTCTRARKFYKWKERTPNVGMTPKMPSTLSALEDSLALEWRTNAHLLKLMSKVKKHNDPVAMVALDDYLERQVDIIYNISNIITRLRQYRDTDNNALGEYILDSELIY